jgi:RNA polymerase sigma-70 factor, ECF subfamily
MPHDHKSHGSSVIALSFREKLAQATRDSNTCGHLLQGFRDYLLAIAHGELDPELRKRFGPSDAVQDAFAVAARGFKAFEGTSEEELRAWLRAILINRCRALRDAHVLTAKRDARREVEVDEACAIPHNIGKLIVNEPTPSRLAVATEDAERLMAALGLLSDDARQAVWLRNWEGLSFDEIGARLGRSGEAARKIFVRAVEKLATLLEAADGKQRQPGS